MKIYEYITEEDSEDVSLPILKENDELNKVNIEGKQHFTQPPARYTEASFVKLLEEKGIGRPSTYVPTISLLLNRDYVNREKKNLVPTELGFIVNNIMSEYFEQIVDVDFTADMEKNIVAKPTFISFLTIHSVINKTIPNNIPITTDTLSPLNNVCFSYSSFFIPFSRAAASISSLFIYWPPLPSVLCTSISHAKYTCQSTL